jgi:hypothetical protein
VNKAISSESLPRTRSGVVTGSRKENASKNLLPVMAGSVFLAKPGAARYQVQAFSAPLLNAPHGPPQ